jgi:hypothetical protein
MDVDVPSLDWMSEDSQIGHAVWHLIHNWFVVAIK